MATRYQYGSLRVRKRAKGSDVWEFRYQENGKTKAVLVGTREKLPTQADAERAVEYLRMRINAQNPQAQFHSLTVGALVDRFINEESSKGRRFQTQLEYKTYLNRYIRKQWGDTFINDVDPVLVKGWLDSLPLAPKTKTHIRNAFHLLFYFARWWKLTKDNPIELVRTSNERLKDPRVITPDQFKALLEELKMPYRTMIIVAGCLGLRASEVMGLQWGDLDWNNLTVFVKRGVVAGRKAETKTKASKKPIPLDPSLATELLKWRSQSHYARDEDFIFAGDSGKPRWQGMILKDHLSPAADRAKIGKIGWHTLRHSYRNWLKKWNAPVEVQKELMRHANLKTTMDIYGLEPEVSVAHREANSGVVKMLLGN